jgi:hypothetical protein
MAGTVTSQLTNVTLAESADGGNWDDMGSGPGSNQTSDSPIQGVEARGRRVDNTADKGFSYDSATGADISAAHAGFWVLCFQPALLTNITLLLGDAATPKSGNWVGHFFPAANYPAVGGWIRVWVDPLRTADISGGTYDALSNRQWGCTWTIGDVGGTALNCQLDRIDYTANGLLITAGTIGAPGQFSDGTDFDSGIGTNRQGVLVPLDGVTYCNARFTIGSAVETHFTDTGFTFIFANQTLCFEAFMGLSIDLSNASTVINLVNGTIKSGGTANLGDITVTGSAGQLNITQGSIGPVRVIGLRANCTLDGVTISESGVINGNNAAFTLTNSVVTNSTAQSALVWNAISIDPDTYLSGTSFISAGTGHAIELSEDTPTTVGLTNVNFTGYSAATGNEAVWVRRTTGTVTINVSGGDTPTIRTDGATVVVNNSVTLTFTGLPNGIEARVRKGAVSLAHTQTITGNAFAYTYNYSAGQVVTATFGGIADDGFSYVRQSLSLTLANTPQTIPLNFDIDPSYVET